MLNFATGPGVTGWIMWLALGVMVWFAIEKRRRAHFERYVPYPSSHKRCSLHYIASGTLIMSATGYAPRTDLKLIVSSLSSFSSGGNYTACSVSFFSPFFSSEAQADWVKGMIQPDRGPMCSAGTIGVFWVSYGTLKVSRIRAERVEILVTWWRSLDL